MSRRAITLAALVADSWGSPKLRQNAGGPFDGDPVKSAVILTIENGAFKFHRRVEP